MCSNIPLTVTEWKIPFFNRVYMPNSFTYILTFQCLTFIKYNFSCSLEIFSISILSQTSQSTGEYDCAWLSIHLCGISVKKLLCEPNFLWIRNEFQERIIFQQATHYQRVMVIAYLWVVFRKMCLHQNPDGSVLLSEKTDLIV